MRLLHAELTRWCHRKGLVVTAALAVVVAAVVCGFIVAAALPPSAADIARAESSLAEAVAEWEAHHEEWYRDCMEMVAPGGLSAEDCAESVARPTLENQLPYRSTWEQATAGAALSAAVIGGLAALAMGASFLGAEYRHGTMSTWLTFVPNRGRVFGAKCAIAVGAGLVVMAATYAVLMLGVAITFAWLRPGDIDAWTPLLQALGRGLGLAVMVTLMGAGLAVVFRHTVAAAALPVGYMLLGGAFNIVGMLPGGLGLVRWLPENNLFAYLLDGWTAHAFDHATQTPVEVHISGAQGATYLVVLTGVIVLAAHLVFWRRDVPD